MTSFRLWFLIGISLTLLDAALSDPVPQNSTVHKPPDEDGCGKKGGRDDFKACIMAHFLPQNVTREIYNESRCPTCAHICSNSQSILDCAFNAIEERALCNKVVRDVGKQFFRDIFSATVTFFCEGGGDRLTTIDDSENMRCIVTQESDCSISLIPNDRKESNDNNPPEINPETLCSNFTSGLSCVAKKAEPCNQETAAIITQYSDYLKTTSPCATPAAGS